jgi:peptide deformylase
MTDRMVAGRISKRAEAKDIRPFLDRIALYRRELAGKPCRRVARGEDLSGLLAELERVGRGLDGVGIAAPQIGVFLQVALLFPEIRDQLSGIRGQRSGVRKGRKGAVQPSSVVLVNPEIENLRGKDILEYEGCLSLPPFPGCESHLQASRRMAEARVWRSEVIEIRSGTVDDPAAGLKHTFRGYLARIVQHEMDHLKGVFFIDHCGPIGREQVLKRFGEYLKARDQLSGVRGQ